MISETAPPDGRATRWAEHNADRRRALVDSAMRTLRKCGPGVGMDEIAAEAGTSKTVFYRHFGDRTGLHQAVVERVQAFIWDQIAPAIEAGHPPVELIRRLADAYLAVVEADISIYQFVINRPQDAPDPVLSITNRIGNEVAANLATWLAENGYDPTPANIWGHGVVGFIYSVSERWIVTDLRRPRAEIVAWIGALFTPAFEHLPVPAHH